jgi:hypothetical protein
LTKEFDGDGQINSTTKYFYDTDHLGSIREMADNSGVIQAQYAYDPYGQAKSCKALRMQTSNMRAITYTREAGRI